MQRMTTALIAGILLLMAGLVILAGCSKDDVAPPKPAAQAPNTELTYAPVENDTVSFRIRFYWSGFDTDGEVVAFRWVVDPDTTGSDSAKAANLNPSNWVRTTGKDTTLLFLVDPVKEVRRHV